MIEFGQGRRPVDQDPCKPKPICRPRNDRASAAGVGEGAAADLTSAIARTQQANAAKSTVQSTEADLKNAIAQKNQAAVRLGSPTSTRRYRHSFGGAAARQGEVVNIGAPIVTIVDLTDTWARAGSRRLTPTTSATATCCVRLPGGTITSGKVFFKGVEGDFATQARCEPPASGI